MVKIKQKKTMNLPQLIEWAWENPDLSHGTTFISNGCERVKIDFRYNPRGVLNLDILNGINISNDIQFTLEEFEEITENTVLPTLIERRDFGNELTYSRYEYVRIKDIKGRSSTVFYIENDDYTMTLIWRDGKLVE